MLSQQQGRPFLDAGFLPPPITKGRLAGAALGIDLRGKPVQDYDYGEYAPSFTLDPRKLVIPEPSPGFKANPDYDPTALPLMIQKEIMNPGFMGAGGFGVS